MKNGILSSTILENRDIFFNGMHYFDIAVMRPMHYIYYPTSCFYYLLINSMKYLTIFLPFLIQLTAARPDVLYEQNIAYGKAFCQGAYLGFQSLLAFMGYYESEAIKEGRASGELIIDAEEDVNDQTQM